MRKHLSLKYFLLMLLTSILLPINVMAKGDITLEVDKTDLEIGDEVTVTAKLSSDEKLYALTATLNYDRNVFTEIDNKNFISKDDTVDIIYNNSNNKFGIINKSGEISTELFKIRLKVKDKANVGNTSITLTNISSSDGSGKTTYDTSSVNVLVTRDAVDGEVPPLNNSQEIIDSNEEIIQTSSTKPIIIGLTIIMIILIGGTIYVIIRKKEKIIVVLASLTVIVLVAIIFFIFTNNRKQDVNKDGKTDYNDATDIMKYLIDFQGTNNEETKKTPDLEDKSYTNSVNSNNTASQNNSSNNNSRPNKDYDVNNDGKVDIEDVGDSTEHVTEEVKYKVDLSELKQEEIYVKRGNITLEFTAEVTLNEIIKKVKIDGVYYPVIYNGSSYSVSLETPNSPGVHDFKISSVILTNNREIDTKLSITKEILKNKPYVDMFTVDDENNTFNFKLEDQDSAFIEGTVIITDANGNEVLNNSIALENHINHEFEEDVPYTITVNVKYDLDSNELNDTTGQKNLYEEEIYHHSFIVESNYNFQIANVNITDAIEKGEQPVISFDSVNDKGFNVEYIVINDKEYDVTLIGENNHYEVALHDIDTSKFGKHHVSIDEIVLSNLKVFNKTKDYDINTLTYTVLNTLPNVDNIDIKNNADNSTLDVKYNIIDVDKALTKLTVVLVDSNEKVLDSKAIDINSNNVTLSYKGNNDGRYRVKFLADCNLGTDRYIYTEKNIGEKEILTQTEVYIKAIKVTNYFPVKNQPKYQITFEVFAADSIKQRYNVVSGITINGLNYDADKTSQPFTSTISFTVPSESGVLELEANRVKLQYEDYNNNRHETFSVEPYLVQIDVLKDKPTIENLEIIDENYQKGTVTFKFDVIDDKGGFEKGEIELNGSKQPIVSGTNEITFENIEKDKTFDLNFYGDYDLDTNTLKGQDENLNSFKNVLINKVSYGLYDKTKYDSVKLTDAVISSHNGNSYFEKTEDINLAFKVDGLASDLNLTVDKIVVKDQEYHVNAQNGSYFVMLPGYSDAGIKQITINEVVLNNGKKITLVEPVIVNLEVLKDAVTVYDFKYDIQNENIKMTLILKDNDKSISNKMSQDVKVIIYDEDNNKIGEMPYSEEMTFKKQNDILRYYVKVYANYDRDVNLQGDNYYANALILDEIISTDKNYIELKDIIDITLYKDENDRINTIENVNVKDLEQNLNSYFLKITMNDMPTIHSKIKKVLNENNRLILVLDCDYLTKKGETGQDIRIDFGKINNGLATNDTRFETFEELIEKIKNNPEGEYNLTHDLDASLLNVDTTTLIDVNFKGILHGNGYTIRNLSKPLFNKIDGGTVENLKFENVNLPANNAKGTLANTASGATIKQVLINGFIKNSAESSSGALIGEAYSNTIIEECKVTGFTINTAWLAQQIGGLVGILENSTIKNSYVIGRMSASWNYVSTLVGNAKGSSVLDGNYSKVEYNNSAASYTCGFACGNDKLVVKNNVSLNKLSGSIQNKFVSSFKESDNNYYLVVDGDTYTSQTGVTLINNENVNKDLFNKSKFNESIWNLKDVSYDATPTFNIEKVYKLDINEVGDAYDETKEILYNNLTLLMPFYNSSKIIKSANNISVDHILNQQEIRHIVPIDETGNVVTYLTKDNPKKIVKIKIVFKNNTKIEYMVRYDNTYDMVASYRINDLKIDYTFNHYIIDSNSQIVNNLTNYLEKLTYEDNLDSLTPTADNRLYREFYNDVTKYELKEFVLKYLSNSNYTNTTNDDAINDYLETEIKTNKKLEKVLYVYNYFRRFYSVDIDGIMLNDLILFNSQGFGKNMTPDGIAIEYLSNDNNFIAGKTSDAYDNTLAKYTGIRTIPKLLEYYVTTLSDQKIASWYANEFKGLLLEINVKDRPDILYTLWDHISYEDKNGRQVWYNYALPILTIPENAAYIISTPTQFLIGAQRVYMINPNDPVEKAKFMENKFDPYVVKMRDYYDTAAGIISDAKYFNEIHTIQIDKRFTYDVNGNLVFQSPQTTQEPFHKNFNDIFGVWAHQDGNAATSNGTFIYWRAYAALDSDWTFGTWSHETAHNIDSRLFLKDNGRRFNSGGEDYADGNLTQRLYESDIVMNLSKHYNSGEYIGSNLDPSRINTQDKVHDFYSKLFETIYIMDYLEGRALLNLTAEEQSKLVVQTSYPNEDKWNQDETFYLNRLTTVYQTIDEETIKQMNLRTISDLTNNRLVMYPGVIYSTIIDNRYGGESIYKVRWYQPHNDYGRPDSYSLKWFAYEMLGYKGYDNGYIEYYSNINFEKKKIFTGSKVEEVNYKTDLMALQKITGDNTMTFAKYKDLRFTNVENNLQYIQYINVDEIYNEFLEALKKDAAYVKQVEAEALVKYPGDDTNSVNARNNLISAARKFENSTAVRRKVYYTIKNSSNDFMTDVYNKNNSQNVTLVNFQN